MHDSQTFEMQLGSALVRYADRVPVDVDVLAFVRDTRTPPATSFGRNWPGPLRLAVALALLVALALTVAALVGSLPSPVPRYEGVFTPTHSMVVSHYGHSQAVLADGRVLLVGGFRDDAFSHAPAEIYDPATESFSLTASTAVPRLGPAVARLNDGRVLVVGGLQTQDDWSVADPLPSTSAERYDPATGTFTATSPMRVPRVRPTATLLRDGRVLITGDASGTDEDVRTAELYDPGTDRFIATGSSLWPGSGAAVLLSDGRVLVIGISQDYQVPVPAEVYDPVGGTFGATGSLPSTAYATTTLLSDGSVLVAGGNDWTSALYEPETGTFSLTGSRLRRNANFPSRSPAALLGDGRVLLVDRDAELYDPTTRSWSLTGPVGENCSVAGTLRDGSVLVTGCAGGLGGHRNAALFH